MSLELIVGCMFSGKSTELIRRIRRFQSIGKRVCVINHAKDTRTDDKVQSHHGDNVKAMKMDHLLNFVNSMEDMYDVICIDEGQFFDDLYASVMYLVDVRGIPVIVAGLNADYRREPFGDMLRLIVKSDDVMFCKAYCGMCKDGTVAAFTKRLSDSQALVDVGASDKYVAVCRKCYLTI
jgi:thymidine kinase